MTDSDRILSPSEAAGLFRVTPRTLRHWSDTGKVPSFRTVGGHRRYRYAELAPLIAPGRAERPPQ
jgi:excisionase family DNA binding protein